MQSEIWTTKDASTYDDDVADMFEPDVLDPAVDFLADLAGVGRVLEFASGSGRVALALADRGLEVTGIELSKPMIDVMKAKAGSERIPVTCGDMTNVRVDGSFGVVYLVFNTITNLLTQDAQVACFENAAAHLEPEGHFVIETFVPALQQIPSGKRLVPFDLSDTHIGIDEYDVATQMLVSHHVSSRPDGVARSRGQFRYGWPAEYDLMARIAGMTLKERWADWDRSPFIDTSTSHISVWQKSA